MAERHAHRDEDQRELADLRHGEPGEEARALAVAHGPHDREDDQRVADQHEEREDDRAGHMRAEERQVERRAERDEEEEEQEVAQRREPGRDGLAVGRGGERDAGEKAAHLLAEPDEIADRREERRLRDGEDHQKLGRARQPLGQRVGHVAHEEHDEADHGDARAETMTTEPPLPSPAPIPMAESTIIASTTTRSCTIRKPSAIWPCSESISRLSDSSFTMMIVEEKVSATAT
jgi:hypothetical protein